jgi:hypothetical protein
MLRPEEEALVEAVLNRTPTDATETNNPFQLSGNEADPLACAMPRNPHAASPQPSQPTLASAGMQGQDLPFTPQGDGVEGASLQSLPSLPSLQARVMMGVDAC